MSLDWKGGGVGKLLAVIRVVSHGHLLGPGVDEPDANVASLFTGVIYECS